MSKILSLKENYNKDISEASEAIKAGKLVVFPTETVYGIGADALNAKAVESIFIAKKRPVDNPLIVHIANMEQMGQLVKEINPQAETLANNYWPGPLTMVLEKANIVPDIVTAGLNSVAVRMPDNKIAIDLIRGAGVPIAAPSANVSGSPSPTSVEHVIADLNGRVNYIIDGGRSNIGVESTVVLLTRQKPVLLRPGGITLEQLEKTLGEVTVSEAILNEVDDSKAALSPGLKYKHYAPKAEVVLVNGSSENFIGFCNRQAAKNSLAVGFEAEIGSIIISAVSYGKEEDVWAQAHNIFAILREADKINKSIIFVHAPSTQGVGLAVYNRLIRAAAFKQINL